MKYSALACDYDGTLVTARQIDPAVLEALCRFRESGRKLILVTGRELESLLADFEDYDVFDRIVVENGGVLFNPANRNIRLLASPLSEEFIAALEGLRIDPLAVGRVIVSSRRPHDIKILEVIRDLGLNLEMIYNKDSVMVLPAGIDKKTGLTAALAELRLDIANTAGVGDAENDLPFISACGCGASVANALPSVKDQADLILTQPNGQGVIELIERLTPQ